MTSSERQPMTAREFFDEYVRKTYEEWQRDPDSRRSMILAIMLNHVADYWQLEKQGQNETGGRKFREDIKKQCPEFGPVWDVAESIKHAKLTRRPDADATAEVSATYSVGVSGPGDHTKVKSARVKIVYTTNGERRPFDENAKKVFSWWRKQLMSEDTAS